MAIRTITFDDTQFVGIVLSREDADKAYWRDMEHDRAEAFCIAQLRAQGVRASTSLDDCLYRENGVTYQIKAEWINSVESWLNGDMMVFTKIKID